MPARYGTNPAESASTMPGPKPRVGRAAFFPIEIPGETNEFGFNTLSKNYAVDTNAAIARADWERYKNTYQPLEDLLLARVGNSQYTDEQISKNLSRFNSGYNSSVAGYQRNLGRYGLTLNADEQTAFNRINDQNRTLGQVETINRTKRDLQDQEYGIIGAGTNTPAYKKGVE